MAFQVSPGVNVSEVDLTAGVQTVSLSAGAFAGPFQWGPALEVTNVGSESDLVQLFGKPDTNTYEYWFSAAAFLAYSNQLKVVRAVSDSAKNACANGTGSLIKNATDYDSAVAVGNAVFGLAAAKYPGDVGNSLKISLCPSALAFEDDSITGTIALEAGNTVVTGTGTTFTSDLVVGDYLGANDKWYQVQTLTNATSLVLATASEDTIASVASGSWSRKWEYADQFGQGAPGTSVWATDRAGANDELHLVVVDEDGLFTGAAGTVLEKYAYLSKASDAKTLNGDTNYYATVLNRQSAYAWWLNHVGTTTNWGNTSVSTTFGASVLPYTKSFSAGDDDNQNITSGNITAAWDVFADPDTVDISLIVAGPAVKNTTSAVVATHLINNLAELRKDCVVFVSPSKNTVVNNSGDEVDDILTERNLLGSTSYAFMDSGWKYTYDKYNDVYRWVPLNGDIAGLAARTDTTNDPWFSPAGFNRGNIKNVVKLSWNPKQLDRDDLYSKGVNPVVTFPAQGTLLYGDKTLLSRPSAFDRINVRRLFIALEKTISRYAKSQLFEFNDEYTRSAFRNVVEPFLRDVKARRGVTDYLVVCDNTNNTTNVIDQNQFVGDIYVKPTRSINFIQLNFVAVRSGVSFQEVVGAV
jgi:hypothetical protein